MSRPERPRPPGARLTRWAGWLFALGLAAFVQWRLGWEALLEPWRRLSPGEALAALALVLLTYLLRSLRQSAYFPERMRGRFWLSTRLMVWHNFYNNLLPMRAGELSFPMLARRYFGIGYAEAAGALLWFRLLDLWAIALFAALAAALTHPWARLVCLALLPAPWLALRIVRPFARPAADDRSDGAPSRAPGRAAVWAGRLFAALPRDASGAWSSCAWTLANWGVKLLAFAWLLTRFADLPYAAGILGAIGGDLTSVLPLHAPAGLGTYEAGVAAGLAPFGIAAANAVPAALSLHLMILASTVIGAVLMSLVPLPEPDLSAP